jgi:predicted O-methyltransferase YrrM
MKPLARLKWAAKSVLDVAYWPMLLSQRASLDAMEDWSGLISEICHHRGRRRIFANQYPAEISALCELARSIQPKIILEIGTSQGGTLYLFSRLVQPGGLIISIDKPGEPGSVRPVMRAVYRTFGKKNGAQVMTLDRDSHAQSTHAEVANLLAGRSVDLLFIDGDHSYEGVKADFHSYRQWVAPNGIVGLHDIAHSDEHRTIKVARFWRELTTQGLQLQSIIAKPGVSPGIGIVRNIVATSAQKKAG